LNHKDTEAQRRQIRKAGRKETQEELRVGLRRKSKRGVGSKLIGWCPRQDRRIGCGERL